MTQSLQVRVQKFGAVLSAMVMPNIGVFIGWGLLAALFIDTGWIPNKFLGVLVSPILTYLLPILLGYTAGSNFYGRRGGVIGAFATIGVVIGSDITMLIGGMVMGPIAAKLLEKFDNAVKEKIPTGMEMMVDNFSLGILGAILCAIGYAGVAPVMTTIQGILGGGVKYLTEAHLLPLVSLFVAPGQVLFLNNAINHGIFTPLGLQQTAEAGKSILFLVEANGSNWVGLAAAFALFGTRMARRSAPGAVLIMFFGGIAEVCFPYCLTQPLTILGPIAGNFFSLTVLSLFDGGAIGPPSPGSVFAFYLMTPKSALVVNSIAYFGDLAISFLVTSIILKLTVKRDADDEEDVPVDTTDGAPVAITPAGNVYLAKLDKVVFACDAGMGSSAMGVSILKTRLAKAQLHPNVDHVAVAEIPADADLVVTNVNLAARAKTAAPDKPILTLSNFMDQKEYDRVVREIQSMLADAPAPAAPTAATVPETAPETTTPRIPVLKKENIVLGAKFPDKLAAINACADLLIGGGYADESYRKDMIARDQDVSVYIGNGVALPHGLASSKETIQSSGICFYQVPEGVDFDGQTAYLVIGVAGKGDEHIDILGQIATCMCEEENLQKLIHAKTADEVLEILQLKV